MPSVDRSFLVRAAFLVAAALALALVSAPGAARASEREVGEALVWLGLSDRIPRHRLRGRDRDALRRAERRLGGVPDGFLDPWERRAVLAAARAIREREGYEVVRDRRTGARLGVPLAWMGPARRAREGTRWASPDGAIDVESFVRASSLDSVEARARRSARITYDARGRNWLVLSGFLGERPFYLRAEQRGGEVRGYLTTFDGALRERLERVVVAMSADFDPFAGEAIARLDGPERRFDRLDREAGIPPFDPDGPEPPDETDTAESYAPLPTLGPDARRRPPVAVAALEPPKRSAPDDRPDAGPLDDGAPIPSLEPSPRRAERARTPGTVDGEAETASAEIDPDETERAVPQEITGMLTDEGQSCPTLRGPDGTLYALVGEVPNVAAGTVVTIEAVAVESERCSAGRAVAVGAFRVQLPR